VLTNARGFTLYSFAPDTPATSKCYGSCAAYWPPVTGTAAACPGLPGRVGTITRTDGSRQAHYNAARPHQGIAQRVPDAGCAAPPSAMTGPDIERIRRKPVLSGLINEYMHAA
jgi:hypothetical protein